MTETDVLLDRLTEPLCPVVYELLMEFTDACDILGMPPEIVRSTARSPVLLSARRAITAWLRQPRFGGALTYSYPDIAGVMRANRTSHSCAIEWMRGFNDDPRAVAYYDNIKSKASSRYFTMPKVDRSMVQPEPTPEPPKPEPRVQVPRSKADKVYPMTEKELAFVAEEFARDPNDWLRVMGEVIFARVLKTARQGVELQKGAA